jgi:hypothetical protein
VRSMLRPILPSLERWWSIVGRERSPLWTCAYGGPSGLTLLESEVAAAVQSLVDSPINLVDFGVKNSGRWDCPIQPYGNAGLATDTLMWNVKSLYERRTGDMRTNPFEMDSDPNSASEYESVGGFSELPPTVWTLPYWMMRYYGYLPI